MDIWFFIILLVAIGLIVGPISMLRPKPAQRRKEALRTQAAKEGFRFGIRTPPKLKTAIDEPVALPVYYLAPTVKMQAMPTWMLIRTDYEHDGNFYRDWDWHGTQRPSSDVCNILRTYLPDLPASVAVISQGEGGTCVYWNEQEGPELLDVLLNMLKELQAIADAR